VLKLLIERFEQKLFTYKTQKQLEKCTL